MKTKICPKCNESKPFQFFGKSKNRKHGIDVYCKKCRKIYTYLHCVENNQRFEKWKKQNREHYLKYKQQYRKMHLNYYANYIKKYHKQRRQTDIKYKITGNLRSRLTATLKNNYKSLSTILLIGCEIDYLMYHLQCQFKKDMSWDNYGKWHVDHIKPCASFDLSKPEEQRKCFHYSNLQPLWAKENQQKSNKFIEPKTKVRNQNVENKEVTTKKGSIGSVKQRGRPKKLLI